jgi:hypothetical protein
VGKGSVLEEGQAAEQPTNSIPGQPQVSPRQLSAFQQAQASAFEDAAVVAPTTAMEATQPPVLTSLGPPASASLSGLSASSVSTELVFMQSSTTSALSGQSITAGLQEAMQQMRLQSVTAPGHLQPPGTQAAGPAALSAQALHHMGLPRSSHDSGDLAQMMGQAQQQVQEHEQTEDGPATVRILFVWLCSPFQYAAGYQHVLHCKPASARNPCAAGFPAVGFASISPLSWCHHPGLGCLCLLSVLQLFFAKVPRTAGRQLIEELFARFGELLSLNLFAPYEVSTDYKCSTDHKCRTDHQCSKNRHVGFC